MRKPFLLLLSTLLVSSLCIDAFGKTGATGAGTDLSGFNLQQHQGKYFRWASPSGWRFSESNAGVTLISADGQYAASLASLLRSRGTQTPQRFLQWVFTHVPSYTNARVLSVKGLPSQRMSYQVWQFIEAKVAYVDNGLPVVGVYKVGVANYSGMNDAMIVGYRAVNRELERMEPVLSRVAKSIVLTNAAEANGNNTIIHPKNNPLDNSGIIAAGQNRDNVREHASEAWREGTMGTEPTIDPKTGQQRNTPLGDWNGARGGYVNPDRPDELLQPYHK
jgi:hypothetical protein